MIYCPKFIYGFTSTRQLIEQLQSNTQLRHCCGWRCAPHVPHEATFSRAFAGFSRTNLAEHLHTALIEKTQSQRLIGHLARDSTAIEVRQRLSEKVKKKRAQQAKRKQRRKPRQSTRNADRAAARPTVLTSASVPDVNVAIPLMTRLALTVDQLIKLSG